MVYPHFHKLTFLMFSSCFVMTTFVIYVGAITSNWVHIRNELRDHSFHQNCSSIVSSSSKINGIINTMGGWNREATLDWVQQGLLVNLIGGVGDLESYYSYANDYSFKNCLLFHDDLFSCLEFSSFPEVDWLHLKVLVAGFLFPFVCLSSSYHCYLFYSFLLSQSGPSCAQY